MGSETRISGGEIGAAIDEGVRRGYEEGYLRKSIIRSPIDRTNTGDNTPAIVYYEPVPGDGLKLTMLVKGAGCDNMSALKMLTPAEGLPAMKEFVVETIEKAGPNASPPLTVGVGIGGPFERAAVLAKKALTRPSGEPNPDPELPGSNANCWSRSTPPASDRPATAERRRPSLSTWRASPPTSPPSPSP